MTRVVLLCVGAYALAPVALSQITVTGVSPTRWGANDQSIGVGGAVVEDFENSTLVPGLTIRWESPAGNVGPISALPSIFDPSLNDPNGTAFVGSAWDGTRALVSARGNQSFPYPFSQNWGDLVLTFNPPARAVGFSIQQAELGPTLVVNGISRGSLFGLAGLAAGSGRNGYVIVESYGGESISTLKIDNVGGDGFAIDHLAIMYTDPVPVFVTGSPATEWGTGDGALGIGGSKIEDFEDTTLVSGLAVEIDSPSGRFGPSTTLPGTFDPVAQDPFGSAFDLSPWDGSRSLLNTRTNSAFDYLQVGNWGDLVLHLSPPVPGVGFSIADVQLEARLVVNGRDSGPLLAQAGLPTGARQGYVRVDALDPAQPIESIRIANGRAAFNDGFAIDHVALIGACAADFNADGDLNPDDIGDFITCFFSPECGRADFNRDSDVNPDDLGDFITAFFTGCN